MTNWKVGLAGFALSTLGMSALAAPIAKAAVVIIHAGRDEPPPRAKSAWWCVGVTFGTAATTAGATTATSGRAGATYTRAAVTSGPGSLGTARGSLRLAQRRMAPAPLTRSGARPWAFGIRHRSLMAVLFAMLLLTSSNRASADEPKPLPPAAVKPASQELAKPVPKARVQPVAVDLNRLGIQLDIFAAQAYRNRLATTFTGIGMAGPSFRRGSSCSSERTVCLKRWSSA